METRVNSNKFFEVIDPRMYGVILLALRVRMDECNQRMLECLEHNGGDLDGDMVRYWMGELEDAKYTYNRLP